VEEQVLFSGDVFGCHYCDTRLFNDRVGDFRFSFDYYYAHIMRPFKSHVLEALKLIEPLPLKLIAPTHGPILRERPRRYVARYRELSERRPYHGLRLGADEHSPGGLLHERLRQHRTHGRGIVPAPRTAAACASRCTTWRAARPTPSST
jgi:hypothetical protein